MPATFDLQPTLTGRLLEMRPLRADDWDALYALASDPLIWEQHPDRERWREERFRVVFREGMESGGALLAVDRQTGRAIGFTRYHDYHPELSEIEIGWTFLARSHWGGRYNSEMKDLMVRHAFKFVDTVVFSAGVDNLRSRRAIEKLGAVPAGTKTNQSGSDSVVYHLTAASYRGSGN
ncbi:MAG TPA: GNAT family N-acetyltransferase [Gemmatimonadales bacterium]|jgi:RimJ/RimL family protein N-acetyltransferase|nr:GNAT family N-acetyltransferase [Gemmatimonadales bacterium]